MGIETCTTYNALCDYCAHIFTGHPDEYDNFKDLHVDMKSERWELGNDGKVKCGLCVEIEKKQSQENK